MSDISKTGIPGDYWKAFHSLCFTVDLIDEAIEENDKDQLESMLKRLKGFGEKGIQTYSDYAKQNKNAPTDSEVIPELNNLAISAASYLKEVSIEKYDMNKIRSFCSQANYLITGN